MAPFQVESQDLLDVLSAGGLRITRARRAVCDVIATSPDQHLDAAAILARIEEMGATADQSTVYRTLEALEDAGLITHAHLGHRAAVYHLAEEPPHQHLVCDGCGVTLAVHPGDLSEWTDAIRSRTGFVIEPTHFALTGLCADCAAEPVQTT